MSSSTHGNDFRAAPKALFDVSDMHTFRDLDAELEMASEICRMT
jgi:hypothetical protein